MIQMQSKLFVADNSGARTIQCIKVLEVQKEDRHLLEIIVSIKDALPRAKVKKGDVYKAVIVRTSKDFKRLMVLQLDLIKMLLFYLINKKNQ